MADTARAEEVGSATAVAAMEDTVGAATAVTAAATVDTVAEVTAGIVMGAVDMDIAFLAEEATVMAIAADMGMDTVGEDTTAVVITDMATATGAVADTTAGHTGAVQYSALDSAMFGQGRFAMTRTDIRFRVMCIHRMGIEVAGPGRPRPRLFVTEGVDWIDTSGTAGREPHCK
jgi:hypothetical protein